MTARRAAALIGLTALALAGAAGAALAQSSLGIGVAEQSAAPTGGPLAGFFDWIADRQREFYRLMTDALAQMRDGGSGAWLLVGLSFLYGVLHAAGPGHGKVVISSYMLANETALRRGVMLSLAASVVQALSAIVIVALGFAILRQMAISQTDTTRFFEISSYVLVVLLGLWLLARKLRAVHWRRPRPAALGAAAVGHGHGAHHHHDHHHDHAHEHGPGETCAACGHAHMPSPDRISGQMDWRGAIGAVMSVGLRPCTGGLVVLTFAFLNGLWLAGIVSVFAMALGTAITVSLLATLAVSAKAVALRLSGSSALSGPVSHGIEIAGALLIIAMGLALLGGALNAP
ncbi:MULTISPECIES: nickel/cobalt transporter [unclassified Roseitalea]|uniref:nickel/cobalt transporter n=1 Tax=unclassified Roseitalea TaxID=2639107 RepID=UPI0027400314|nr:MULTISPECIES: nickel/cobalt transporter [unclassified Roseitalea]